MAQVSRVGRLQAGRTALFICDMQDKFRNPIFRFANIEAMTVKMLKAAEQLSLPVYATEQNPKALGPTVSSLSQHPFAIPIQPKTKFSMVLPPIVADLQKRGVRDVAIVGIESHVCVLQTALDLLDGATDRPLGVHILADAVSSCNAEERPIAFQRIRDAGGHITTTESFLFQLLNDASHPSFKAIAGLIKETKNDTADALKVLAIS